MSKRDPLVFSLVDGSGITRKSNVRTIGGHKVLADGTPVEYCNPHRRWEWDCQYEFPGGMHCGSANSSRQLRCNNCGTPRA